MVCFNSNKNLEQDNVCIERIEIYENAGWNLTHIPISKYTGKNSKEN